jgi:hypothetical protein
VLSVADAGSQLVSPAWLASTMHCPLVMKIRVVPENEHTLVVSELKVTDNPEVAVASTETLSPAVAGFGSGEPKEMDCCCGVGPGVGCGLWPVGRVRVGAGCGGWLGPWVGPTVPTSPGVEVACGAAGGTAGGLAKVGLGVHSSRFSSGRTGGVRDGVADFGNNVEPPATDSLGGAVLVGATECSATDPMLAARLPMRPDRMK